MAIRWFCRRPNTEVSTLLPLAARVAPWQQNVTLESSLADLPRIAAADTQVEQTLVERVRKSRTRGATWARIGDALGMTRQSAWERFSCEERAARRPHFSDCCREAAAVCRHHLTSSLVATEVHGWCQWI